MILLLLARVIGQDVSLQYLRYFLIAVSRGLRVAWNDLIPILLLSKASHNW